MDLRHIVDACRNGDKNAQSTVYNKCWSIIYPSVYLILRNKEEAEDAMQEGFIKGFKKLSDLKDSGKFIGWQKSICVREALDRVRKKKNILLTLSPVVDSALVEVEYDHQKDVTIDMIKTGLKTLSEGAQLIIQLHLMEGMTHIEIAEQLGIEHAACRTQYSRALAKLRNNLTLTT